MSTATVAALLCLTLPVSSSEPKAWLRPDSQRVLSVPETTTGEPGPGRRVRQTPPEYAGTDVFHTLWLPQDWKPDGRRRPVIFEYTGNYFPASGSTGEPQDAALGFCLTGGRFIWVCLPYVSPSGRKNAVRWWGDTDATVEYAKKNVPRLIRQFHADPENVFLCGFSRGAIGVSYLGLHDDQIAKLWTAFISHDHFDGVREWQGTDWGSPLAQYRKAATTRLRRVAGRPWLVCQNGTTSNTQRLLQTAAGSVDNFQFLNINAEKIFGTFPNTVCKSPHTDRWAVVPGEYRAAAWHWVNTVTMRSAE